MYYGSKCALSNYICRILGRVWVPELEELQVKSNPSESNEFYDIHVLVVLRAES